MHCMVQKQVVRGHGGSLKEREMRKELAMVANEKNCSLLPRLEKIQ